MSRVKVFVWCDHIRSEYWVFATSIKEARQKMRTYYSPNQNLERIIQQKPEVRPMPDIIAALAPDTIVYPKV